MDRTIVEVVVAVDACTALLPRPRIPTARIPGVTIELSITTTATSSPPPAGMSRSGKGGSATPPCPPIAGLSRHSGGGGAEAMLSEDIGSEDGDIVTPERGRYPCR